MGTLFAFSYSDLSVYLIDAFGIYAASAVATNTVIRSLFSAALPLVARPLYAALRFGWGDSFLALIALVLSPMPFLLIDYGERIRRDPRFQPNL